MNPYLSRLLVIIGLFLFFIGVGALITQEASRVPLLPEQVAAAAGIYDLSWSGDGRSIAFVSAQSGTSELWTVSAAGGPPQRITSTGLTKRQPRWSKDGGWIAFVAIQAGRTGTIQIVSADGREVISLTPPATDARNPAWSPDSSRIAFTDRTGGRDRIAVVDIETAEITRLAEITASSLEWSPDGEMIAFVSNPMLPSDDRRDNEDLFIISAEGGTPRLLTPGTQRFREFAPSWAPDSRRLVYASDSTGYSNLYSLDVETGSTQTLTTGSVELLSPKWSPDGQHIAYLRNQDAEFHIFVTPAAGGRVLQISDRDGVNGGFGEESRSPLGTFEWSPDGTRIAFTHADPGRTADVWVAALDGSRSVQVTNSMPAELRREARFVWPDTLSYRSFDGEEVSALVYRPPGTIPRTGHPTLLVFRDALEGQMAKGWDPFIQFFVNDGYLVFAPNVRGSSGRGQNYRQLVFQQGGDHDIRDAFFGLDRLSSEGLIDTERIGVFGAGAGGFLTHTALIRGETRFKAAVSLYGILDAVTATSYPGMGAWTRYMIGSTPMANPHAFYERSLVNFIDNLRTPIIFLYLGGDPAAPFQQLQQFAVPAEVKGKWFDYRVFDNESESWQFWRPSNLRLALEAMDALFKKYLLGTDTDIRLSRGLRS